MKRKIIKQGKIKKYTQVILIYLIALIFISCKRSNNGSSQGSDNLWGIGNPDKIEINNSYNDKVPEASKESYTYYTSEEFQSFIIDKMNGKVASIYDNNYQEIAFDQVQLLKEQKVYTLENPLFIMNPFGTNTCGLYVYMGNLNEKVGINYTVSIEDKKIADFEESMFYNYDNKIIEGQIIGLLQGHKNKVVLEVEDLSGNLISKKAYYFDVTDLDTIKEKSLRSEFGEDIELTRGLYTFHAVDGATSHFLYYDNFGTIRAEISTELKNSHTKVLQIGNHIFYAVRDDLFVLVNNLGYIENYYQWGNQTPFIDYDCDKDKNKILFIVDSKNYESNAIIGLDLASGEYKEYLNVEKLMDKSIELDGIQVVDGKDIIVNSKEISSIIRINNIYTSPVVRWIIANENDWKGTKYEVMLLDKRGNFTTQIKQESIIFSQSRRLEEGQFYLSLFNTAKDMGGQKRNSILNENQANSTEENSFYYQYLVDEGQNRYDLIKKIELPYSSSSCTAMPYGNKVVISLGFNKEFREYNAKGEIMSKYLINDTNSSYQIFKYTMDRYWF